MVYNIGVREVLRLKSDGCKLCPRVCGADRVAGQRGRCGMDADIVVARAAPHMWEEPCISGRGGAGAVFFAGCPLGCVFCQNRRLSREGFGALVSEQRLGEIFLELQDTGVHNIDLVTPTQYSEALARVLTCVRPRLKIPVIYNCGGYESVETLRMLDGLIDIYLPDFKYASAELAGRYSGAPDYPERAYDAICEMYRQCGPVGFDGDGMMKRGVMVRHLVLPGCRHDSERVLRLLAEAVPVGNIRLSLMRQYTPDFVDRDRYPELGRRLTTFEYRSVVDVADRLGFDGYCQQCGSDSAGFTPIFDLTGVYPGNRSKQY